MMIGGSAGRLILLPILRTDYQPYNLSLFLLEVHVFSMSRIPIPAI